MEPQVQYTLVSGLFQGRVCELPALSQIQRRKLAQKLLETKARSSRDFGARLRQQLNLLRYLNMFAADKKVSHFSNFDLLLTASRGISSLFLQSVSVLSFERRKLDLIVRQENKDWFSRQCSENLIRLFAKTQASKAQNGNKKRSQASRKSLCRMSFVLFSSLEGN